MTPDLILFQSYCFMFYIINTYSIFSHAYNSKIITMDYVRNVVFINYELVYIFCLAYIMLVSSQYMYILILNTFNYCMYIGNKYKFESNRFNFIKPRLNKKNNILELKEPTIESNKSTDIEKPE